MKFFSVGKTGGLMGAARFIERENQSSGLTGALAVSLLFRSGGALEISVVPRAYT
jgi:hypothetical protein